MHIKPSLGSSIQEESRKCAGIATMLNETVWLTFNGTKIRIDPGQTPAECFAKWLEQRGTDQVEAKEVAATE